MTFTQIIDQAADIMIVVLGILMIIFLIIDIIKDKNIQKLNKRIVDLSIRVDKIENTLKEKKNVTRKQSSSK